MTIRILPLLMAGHRSAPWAHYQPSMAGSAANRVPTPTRTRPVICSGTVPRASSSACCLTASSASRARSSSLPISARHASAFSRISDDEGAGEIPRSPQSVPLPCQIRARSRGNYGDSRRLTAAQRQFTRTPGDWATWPHSAGQLLNGGSVNTVSRVRRYKAPWSRQGRGQGGLYWGSGNERDFRC
jgi:hypothetical protein